MLIQPGEKLHIITRRLFEGDLRRHFVGEIEAVSEAVARVQGYAFVHESYNDRWVRRPELRTRLFSLFDAQLIINVLPRETEIAKVTYSASPDRRLVCSDGGVMSLDINEFSDKR